MATSTRFAIALHILAYLSVRGGGGPLPSERIALSVATNPSVVRRLLGQLTAAGLTRSQMGTGGGAELARPTKEITLLEVHRAVDDLEVFANHRSPPSPKCLVGRNIPDVLDELSGETARAVERVLEGQTVADVVDKILDREERRASVSA